MKRILYISVLALLVASCGIWGKYHREVPVPDNVFGDSLTANVRDTIVSLDSTILNTSFGAIGWREIFRDPCLRRLIDTALVKNQDLLTAHENVIQAEASLTTARLSYLPTVSLGSSASPVVTWNQGGDFSYSGAAYASWQLDLFGQLTNRKWAAKATKEQMKDMEQAVRASLIASVANCYFTLQMYDAQMKVALEARDNWEKTVEVIYYLKESGMTTEAGAAQMEANYHDICAQVKNFEAAINEMQNVICSLIASTPKTIERTPLDYKTMPEKFDLGIPVGTLLSRPDVRSAERALEAAYYNLHASRSDFFPSIILGGSFGWIGASGAISSPAESIAVGTANLIMSLFNSGKLMAANKVASSKQTQARLALEKCMLDAGLEVNNLLVTYQKQRENIEIYQKEVTALARASESTEFLMKYGTTTYLEVLTAKNTLLTAQLTQLQNQAGLLQTATSLYQALGGGAE